MLRKIKINISEINLKWLEKIAKITNQDELNILEKLVDAEIDHARSSITFPEDFTRSHNDL